MGLTTRSISSLTPAGAVRRRVGLRLVAAESFSAILDRIEPAVPSTPVARGPVPVFLTAAAPGDRVVLAQFLADLAAAPAIAGELVALYVEQHPRLAIWFAARAVAARADAADQIEAAARWREVCGATALAELIRAALAIACPPAAPDPAPPPVILDLDLDVEFDGDAVAGL